MNVEQLEKLAKLKEQGLISEEEYETNKKKLLKSSGKSGSSAILYTILGIVLFVGIVFFVSAYEEYYEEYKANMYGCNDDTMGVAQDLINQQFPNFNDSLKLKNPELVSTKEGYLLCRASTILPELAVVHYTVHKQEEGELLIRTNPAEDLKLNAVLGFLKAIEPKKEQQKIPEEKNEASKVIEL